MSDIRIKEVKKRNIAQLKPNDDQLRPIDGTRSQPQNRFGPTAASRGGQQPNRSADKKYFAVKSPAAYERAGKRAPGRSTANLLASRNQNSLNVSDTNEQIPPVEISIQSDFDIDVDMDDQSQNR